MPLMRKIIEGSTEKMPLKKDLIWTRARARLQIAGDKSADAHFCCISCMFCAKDLPGLDQQLSHSKMNLS